MGKNEPLSAIEGMEAADELQEVFTKQPVSQFLTAFTAASATPAHDFDNNPTTVAGIWIESFAPSITRSDRAKAVANAALTNTELLRGMNKKARFFLTEALFPHFDVPSGWRQVAKEAELERNIATFITKRFEAIKSRKDAERESAFIDEMLAVPDDPRLRYQPLFNKSQLRKIADKLHRYAPEKLAAAKDPRSMWRHGAF